MKVVILAGGKGTRITEESQYKPKPTHNTCRKLHIMQSKNYT